VGQRRATDGGCLPRDGGSGLPASRRSPPASWSRSSPSGSDVPRSTRRTGRSSRPSPAARASSRARSRRRSASPRAPPASGSPGWSEAGSWWI
jgi:hypothetical protein